MPSTSKIAHPIIRRVTGSTPGYEILDLSILPGDPEVIRLSYRNPRQPEVIEEMPLLEALERLFPRAWPETPDTPQEVQQGPARGYVDAKDLEDSIMVDSRLTENERARFWKVVREVQTGEWPGGDL